MERCDVSYSLLATDFMTLEFIGSQLEVIAKQSATGQLNPIRHIQWNLQCVNKALKHMVQARQIGKIVVRGYENTFNMSSINEPRKCLISGGLGELGILVAIWLAGAPRQSSLSLIGRSGRAPPGVKHFDELLSFHGVLRVLRSDISYAEEAAALCNRSGDQPLTTSIFHAGGVLRDAALANQTFGSSSFCVCICSQACGRIQSLLPECWQPSVVNDRQLLVYCFRSRIWRPIELCGCQ